MHMYLLRNRTTHYANERQDNDSDEDEVFQVDERDSASDSSESNSDTEIVFNHKRRSTRKSFSSTSNATKTPRTKNTKVAIITVSDYKQCQVVCSEHDNCCYSSVINHHVDRIHHKVLPATSWLFRCLPELAAFLDHQLRWSTQLSRSCNGRLLNIGGTLLYLARLILMYLVCCEHSQSAQYIITHSVSASSR